MKSDKLTKRASKSRAMKTFLAKLFDYELNADEQIKCTIIKQPVLNEAEM